MLAHEDVHRRRKDNLWRLLAIGVVCVHWFNPLAWVMLRAFLADLESSCDEVVVRGYSPADRKAYATTLLRFADDQRLLAATGFGTSKAKARIIGVLHYQRLTLIGAAAAALLVAAVAVALLTNPQVRG